LSEHITEVSHQRMVSKEDSDFPPWAFVVQATLHVQTGGQLGML
jgi:hypothetical protein